MNEQPVVNSILAKVATPSVFWRSIQTWVRIIIVIPGIVIGLTLTLPMWGPVAPVILLIILNGSGAFAVSVVSISIVLFLFSLFVGLVVVPWILFHLVWWIICGLLKANKGAALEEFIFKS